MSPTRFGARHPRSPQVVSKSRMNSVLPLIARLPRSRRFLLAGASLLACTTSFAAEPALGLFEAHGDIGIVKAPGSVRFDPAVGTYTVTGYGLNMWAGADAFHYVYKKASGDIALAADIEWLGQGVDSHRKACLVIRQDLSPGSPYADVAVHGDGLASLQYRETPGGMTRQIRIDPGAPRRVRLTRQGDYVYVSTGGVDGTLRPAGGMLRLKLAEPFYIGLGVCPHNKDVDETAVFSKVAIEPPAAVAADAVVESTLETVAIATLERTVVHHARGHFEAPNWTPDGKTFIYNSGGLLYRLPATGGTPERIDTGIAKRCNNDHGLSPDGRQIVISDQTETGKSIIYTLPISGGTPTRITPNAPSYWHGWSPDGKTLAYCAERGGEFDIYTIPAQGGAETRLTTAPGLDDGSEYSPDGKWIYFNSERTGRMQIWRMHADGSAQEPVTADENNNWFAHPSPDGKWIVFLTYLPEVKGHPPGQHVMLRLKNLATGEVTVLAKLFGGQGTINVPSWSPDSSTVAFVSYQMVNP